jgi:hypothetical protein
MAVIKQTAESPLPRLLGISPWYGAGVVNAEAAVAAPGARC